MPLAADGHVLGVDDGDRPDVLAGRERLLELVRRVREGGALGFPGSIRDPGLAEVGMLPARWQNAHERVEQLLPDRPIDEELLRHLASYAQLLHAFGQGTRQPS